MREIIRVVTKAEHDREELQQSMTSALRNLVERAEKGEFRLVGVAIARPDDTIATLYAGDLDATANLNFALDLLKGRLLNQG